MNPEQDILNALRALGESDRDKHASPETELRLKLAFRRHRVVRRWRQATAWAIAAAAVVAIVSTVGRGPRPPSVASPPTAKVADTATTVSVTPAPQSAPPAVGALVPRTRARRAAEREIVTDFFPLMDVPPPIGRGALVRVYLPAGAMRTVGLPVREDRLSDRVQADVLVSEEGLATAIRFVKVSQ